MLGDLTFQEAYERSQGRILCVCACPIKDNQPPCLLNYLTAPHCVIATAIFASCAIPGIFPPQALLAKNRKNQTAPWQPGAWSGGTFMWRSGVLQDDIPIHSLRELFNVNFLIFSQTNPYITPILIMKRRVSSLGNFWTKLVDCWEIEFQHRIKQMIRYAPIFDLFGFGRVLNQKWEGNVTIVMQPDIGFLSSLSRLSPRDLSHIARRGERATWRKLGAIEANCGIEQQLDKCVHQLKTTQIVPVTRRGRVPSWNILSMGHGSIDSSFNNSFDNSLAASPMGSTGSLASHDGGTYENIGSP
eukprot:CAMPEP_0197845754 /NCGR_PEP_ID=MMETSP1438-20131217/2645_1 /TAXON_ID=1461541 /ORGANISM="Pterosperma sp., Strain CCMP1384" /LENGTH=300 /DNA_ID=CAMNT_0043457173 /DNA_START=172 /DNA_END=1074 /DNA_ORIENTATION=-